MKFEIIDYFTYKKINYDSVFDDSHNNSYRIYGKLVEGDSYAKIAWSSDLLQPQFLKIFPKVYAIGIDQNFAIYDFKKKHRIMCLDLMFLFCEMVMYNKKIFVATELEVFVIDIQQYKVVHTISLSDTYNKIEINCGNVEIHCMDNTFIKYHISNN
ncbi:hypothetical protein [Prevotella multiformis]|uniref:Uncharacterized protein n=1 Tax=Prevotella multiformis DSM 16608 TaxID=888743 RepID=F0F951_9BACT|nr:hypothetical protein [Prevotella multiformis]EGC19350.1 hypothetical protein HMPREF9141_2118 [Prevotella multiformis DSM 16608]